MDFGKTSGMSLVGTFRNWLVWLMMSGLGGEADLAVAWVEVRVWTHSGHWAD